MRVDVVDIALRAAYGEGRPPARVVVLAPSGRPLDDRLAGELAREPHLALLCGRYEGIDERVRELVSDRVSIGPYVLSGGEIAAAALLDAVVRKIEGAVSNPESVSSDSFASGLEGALEHPHYTRPAEFRGWQVPPVLLSGHHGEVARWRREQLVRPAGDEDAAPPRGKEEDS